MTHALHQRLPANTPGRDYIVGDLHGCLDLFQETLDHVGFNPDNDRVFSVGDLADRGPSSLKCLRLLNEPWFHAVCGNHEQMLIDCAFPIVMPYASDDSADRFFLNGGHWVKSLNSKENAELWNELIPRVAKLPYVITVGNGDTLFHVAHAELMTGSPEVSSATLRRIATEGTTPDDRILTDDELTEEVLAGMTDALIWGRRVLRASKPERASAMETALGPLLVSRRPWHPGLSLTYVGHTVVKKMRLHASHLFIDQGAFLRTPDSDLLMLCHDEVHTTLSGLKP